jgi:dTDP-4-amino-4,6-dideoxygalactose transaminase
VTYLAPDPPLTLADLVGLVRAGSPLPRTWEGDLSSPIDYWFATGRAALLAGSRALGIGPGDEVLLPAYLCESVVTPVQAVGAIPTFYPVGRDFAVDPALVDRAVGPQTRAVVVIHYLGFPGPIEGIRDLCRRRGVALIEDCAHALYSRHGTTPLGSYGDLAIFSPWKSLPLPDGGLLVLNRPDLAARVPAERPSARQTAFRLAYRSLGMFEQVLGWSPRLALLQRPGLRRSMHEQVSAGPVAMEAGSAVAGRLMRGARPSFVVGRRRRNFARLLEVCQDLTWAEPVFRSLPDGVCPLGLPLVAEDRDRWRDALLKLGVNVRTYWEQLPSAVDIGRFPDAAWLRDRILVLPVHQGLPSGGVEWLARLLPTLPERT